MPTLPYDLDLWTIGMGLKMGETGPSTRHKIRGCCHGDLSKDAVWGGTVRTVREGALIQIISVEKGEQWIRLCWSRIWTICSGLSGKGKGALWEPHSSTDGGAGAHLAQCHIEVVTLYSATASDSEPDWVIWPLFCLVFHIGLRSLRLTEKNSSGIDGCF